MGILNTKLLAGQKVITAEITPPKGSGIKKLVKNALTLKPWVDALNITDCQRALVKMSSLAACRILLDQGIEPVFQLTCRDRNRIALQADIFGAGALGIPNMLCLTGDPVKVGDCPEAKPVFELESVRLLQLAKRLQSGADDSGHKLNASPKLFLGSAINPTLKNNTNQLSRMAKKIEAGASFFQTQANYDMEDLCRFVEEANRFNSKILVGILILHSYESAQYIHENIPGIQIPDAILERFKNSKTPDLTGVELALEMMNGLKNIVDGFHVMSVRQEELIAQVLENYHGNNHTQNHSAT
ncbi:MAG: methylenetetrahydrofolate reductase [Proteobacteria bacterium]|nr:methylenetetrahydrofolate reductase [Pseudomonadota bacterium]